MKKIKKGDIVARKSYGKDIIFYVKRIIKNNKKNIAILCGVSERIEADSYLQDLELVDSKALKNRIKEENKEIEERTQWLKKDARNLKEKIITGKILHLDGDRRYSQKSIYYYKKLGLTAVVKNVSENRQPKVVYQLLKTYNPDILIITGHDRYD